MADVKLKDGFVRIANALYEALYRLRIPARHKDVISCVIRFTYGFNRSRDTFAASQLASETGIEVRNVRTILADLVEWKIIHREDNGKNRAPTLSIVTDFDKWMIAKTKNARAISARSAPLSTTRQKTSVGLSTTPQVGSSTTLKLLLSTTDSKDNRQKDSGGTVVPVPIDPYRLPPDVPKLSDNAVADMIATKPNGVLYEPDDVRIWFAAKAPHMRLTGKKKLTVTARNWWRNLKPGEVSEARQWLRDVNARERGREIQAEIDAADIAPEFTPEQLAEASSALQ